MIALWIILVLLSITIAVEASIANRRLNEHIADLELWVRDDDDDPHHRNAADD